MKIVAVTVTCNRINLLPRALSSIKKQQQKVDLVIVVSNSSLDNFKNEQEICKSFGFLLIKNERSQTYSGALNFAIEEIIKRFNITENLYFACLDDDDEWLPSYVSELIKHNTQSFDLLAAYLLRLSETEFDLQKLPSTLSSRDFLIGNPGICGSNTFVKVSMILKAGGFDESLKATTDRDFLVRLFQQNPTYKIIEKHLVTQHTNNNRPRLTTCQKTKTNSLQHFYFKYHHLMDDEVEELFFNRANTLFSIQNQAIQRDFLKDQKLLKQEFSFANKGDIDFVIGFIGGKKVLAERVVKQIIELSIPISLLVIIDNTPEGESFSDIEYLLNKEFINYKIISPNQWKKSLSQGDYGDFFRKYRKINSIPLGRTILHHSLFVESAGMQKPVFWIIDDDILFQSTTLSTKEHQLSIPLFDIIHENLGSTDAIVGAMSCDPPIPTLSCMRGQLIDFLYSYQARASLKSDYLKVQEKPDNYYDLSDRHSDHLESPIFHTKINENDLLNIFSGKAVSRIAIQRNLRLEEKIISRRGANTLVLNRNVLKYYPVVNYEVNGKFARRGDLTWALFNQLISKKKFIEHTFAIDHHRLVSPFNLKKELEKSAYDIIGYAFNKGIRTVTDKIRGDGKIHRPKDILLRINHENYFHLFHKTFKEFLSRREARFYMNFYRIEGLCYLLKQDFPDAKKLHDQLSDLSSLALFKDLLRNAEDKIKLHTFFERMLSIIWDFGNSLNHLGEQAVDYQELLEHNFNLEKKLKFLGKGNEGVVFTNEVSVYKIFYDIPLDSWTFLKSKAFLFSGCDLLEKIEFFEVKGYKAIRYPYHSFKPIKKLNEQQLIPLLRFSRKKQFVLTNIKAENFVQTKSGQLKFIDYGKSFEPYSDKKFINSVKRAFLLIKINELDSKDFQELVFRINRGEIPQEIKDWKNFYQKINLTHYGH